MPAPGLSRVDRVLYRTLQKLAKTFDRQPALKVRCCCAQAAWGAANSSPAH